MSARALVVTLAAPATMLPNYLAATQAVATVTTVASDKATNIHPASLMMADAATLVVLAVLLSAVASEDAVLMDADMILSMTTVRLVASTPAVSSLLSNVMLVISATSVVREVSQAFTVSKPTFLRDQDSADSRVAEASITASVDSVMLVPTRTLAVSVV